MCMRREFLPAKKKSMANFLTAKEKGKQLRKGGEGEEVITVQPPVPRVLKDLVGQSFRSACNWKGERRSLVWLGRAPKRKGGRARD